MTQMASKENILGALTQVMDPDFNRNIVELGFVQNLEISGEGKVSFDLVLTTPACPVKEKFQNDCERIVGELPGIQSVEVRLSAQTRRSTAVNDNSLLKEVKHILAVASGKGGVGKSTATANLAMTLAMQGAKVGVLDADIYGPSMCQMFATTEGPTVNEDKTINPVTVEGGIQLISMAMFTEGDKATIWRGPMVSQMIQNFVFRVNWGALDYLLIDLPPGTGDVQLTLTQQCPLSGAIIITTPQDVSVIDAKKGLRMFETVHVPVLGVIENMSYFICDGCTKKHFIFRTGGGLRISRSTGTPFLAQIPIEPGLADGADNGTPFVKQKPDSETAKIYRELAGKVASQLSLLTLESSEFTGQYDKTWDDLEEVAV